MSELLAGKTAVVTGGASGIGRGIALSLARHGADIVVADVRRRPRVPNTTPTLEALAEETDARSAFVECDVTDREDLVAAVDRADEFGGLDVMVNNAGISVGVSFDESTGDDFDEIVGVNLRGVYFGSQTAARAMRDRGGSIVNVGSTAAERGYDRPGSALYAATKGGVRSMTFALAEILGPSIRVNAIQPGFTAATGLAERSGHTEAYKRARAAESPLDRLGRPDDVGGAAVFLASDLSSYVTAETLLVDGGWVHTGGP